MADSRITVLPEFTGVLAPDDWVYMVDKSDVVTDSNSEGSGYKIQVKNLAGRMLLQTATPFGGEFDFDNIPAGFNRLYIFGEVRSTGAGASDILHWFVNADTTSSNYHGQSIGGNNGSSSGVFAEASTAQCGIVAAAGAPVDSYSQMQMKVEDYTGTFLKSIVTRMDHYQAVNHIRITSWANFSAVTAAITRIRLRTDNFGVDNLLGTLRLYGEV